jgi:hypothetical protein
MMKVFDKSDTKWQQVSLEDGLKDLGLDKWFPEEVCFHNALVHAYSAWLCCACQAGWPQVNAVHQLATKLKKVVKESGDKSWKPWLAVELKQFLPDSFPEYLVVNFEAAEDKQPKAATRRLELAAWLAAWDGCARVTVVHTLYILSL